ncbi:MAG TPA: glycosyltransferase family 4 protein [Chloroflexi bacterium]|jgi:glycosyltransferase involved in cell wall biosynthesis|nr:glycosyltransferase family 4 protein [Chloroflexota bacterium]
MRIACIATSQIPSTTANSIQVMKVCQALALAAPDADVHLWVPGKNETPWEQLAGQYGVQAPFTIHWVPSQRAFRRYDLIWSAYRAARRWGADLFYTWLPQVALLALRDGCPAVLEVHDRPTGRIGPILFGQYFRQPGRKRTLVISHALRRALEERYRMRFPEAEIQIAPNGVDMDRYRDLPSPSEARAQLGLEERLTAVYSGHLYAGRGMSLLLGLAEAFPQVNFLWAGGQPDAVERWRGEARSRGLDNVRLTGFIENARLPLYQAAGEILLMPYERSIAGSSGGNSADICSPMKMFEYMAAGRAILSSDLPVIREVLNEDNAVLAPPEDLQAWVTALGGLLEDAERRKRLGEMARADVLEYTWDNRARKALAPFI